MPQTDKLNALFQSALGACLLLSCALGHAQENNPREDNKIKNPKECLQTELVWTEDNNSDANSLIRDYFFSYPAGIKLTNGCDETVSTVLGVDAVLGGIVEDLTSPGGGITNVETTSEEVLECEWFSTFLFAGATETVTFPERVRDTAEKYHYARASHLGSNPDKPDYWENLGWQHIRYKGCAAWSDERMKIGTGYRHACLAPCPGQPGVVANYFFSGEVVQATGSGEQVAETETFPDQTALARELAGEMVSIPGGSFDMGDLSGDGYNWEKPIHTVTVPAFRLGKYEVTFAQWDACVADGGCDGYSPDDEGWGRGDRPVINVSWDDVQSFIDWLNNKTNGNYRLPTEAEWEYAARAGSTTKYSWGDDIGHNQANCDDDCGDSWAYTAPVGSFPANPWGLHDVHGNVFEWVQDCFNPGYGTYLTDGNAPTDGSAWTTSNWTTSGVCDQRMTRGGSWEFWPSLLRSAYRSRDDRTNRNNDLGFRLAQNE